MEHTYYKKNTQTNTNTHKTQTQTQTNTHTKTNTYKHTHKHKHTHTHTQTHTPIWIQESTYAPLLTVEFNHILVCGLRKYSTDVNVSIRICWQQRWICVFWKHSVNAETFANLISQPQHFTPSPRVFPRIYALSQRTIYEDAEEVRALYKPLESATSTSLQVVSNVFTNCPSLC